MYFHVDADYADNYILGAGKLVISISVRRARLSFCTNQVACTATKIFESCCCENFTRVQIYFTQVPLDKFRVR